MLREAAQAGHWALLLQALAGLSRAQPGGSRLQLSEYGIGSQRVPGGNAVLFLHLRLPDDSTETLVSRICARLAGCRGERAAWYALGRPCH
jgi:hypothetical protein